MKLLRILIAVSAVLTSSVSYAAFIFTDISVATHSVTFTIDGDMSGYLEPEDARHFNLFYSDSIYAGSSGSAGTNLWSMSVFDNKGILDAGNTGGWKLPTYDAYSWSVYDSNLADAQATQRTITLSTSAFLTAGAIGQIDFVWGLSGSTNTILHTANVNVSADDNVSAVPIPAAVWLFGPGLIALVGVARRKKTG